MVRSVNGVSARFPGVPYIVAEAGVNHGGSLSTAFELVSAAKSAGADAVKFQIFSASELASVDSPLAEYQKKASDKSSQIEMLEDLELSREDFQKISEFCQETGISFLCTAFDQESLEFLVQLGISAIKIPSAEITNRGLLLSAASYNLPIVLSTGGSYLEEVKEAITVLESSGNPLLSDLTVLQCTSAYPAKESDSNISAMITLREELGVSVGYSDHTLGSLSAIVATALGARFLEKHLTLDKTAHGPDHAASATPEEFADYVRDIRRVATILGESEKVPSQSEGDVIRVARRSLFLSRDIGVGHQFSEDDFTAKRPGGGVSPMALGSIVGKKSSRDYRAGEMYDAP